ncbi:MAG TPA: YkgJ family cysteine cluster protein [Spirochaetia bacterium]|nr:YkgJ family cysteine cluster protein [Spirochaetia bacterium]
MQSAADRQGGKVRILPVRKGGVDGYDLAVRSGDATVADYLVALDKALRMLPLTRTRNPEGRCQGCAACCAERIPLTSIDFWQLTRRCDPGAGLLAPIADVTTDGRSVDIVLKRNDQGRCVFFDSGKGLCRVYRARPLVCRTFICCPVSTRASELRGALTNAGEDELVRLWLAQESPPSGVTREDWRTGAFTGHWSYREVKLRDCVSPGLWRRLYQ